MYVMNKCSARRALPDNDKKKYKWFETLQRNTSSWKLLIQGKLLTQGHACPLGGRAMLLTSVRAGEGAPPARSFQIVRSVAYITLSEILNGFSKSTR